MKFYSKLVLAGIIGLCAAGGYWVYHKAQQKSPLAGVISTTVKRGDIEVAVLANGTVRPSRLVAVGAQASGRITSLKVKVGDKVAKGQLIAEIDSLSQQNALKTAQAGLSAVRAQKVEKQATLENAQATFAREQQALERRATSQSSYLTAQTGVKTAQAQIAALDAQIAEAQVAVENAEVNLGYTRVTAPIDGTVLLVEAQEGQTVNAVQTAPTIVVLGQIDRMTIQAEISEADVVRVKPGQNVYFTILGDLSRRWDARLETIDPAPDSLRSDSALSTSASSSASSGSSSSASSAIYYYGRFDVANEDLSLKTYMTAEVHVVLGEAKNALVVPASAVVNVAQGKTFVEVVGKNDTIERRAVKTGLTDKNVVEILSGLREGERIVTSHASGTFTSSRPRGPMGL